MTRLRRLRAMVVTGFAWTVAWGTAGVLATPILRLLPPGAFAHPAVSGLSVLRQFAGYGFFAGCCFAVLLKVAGKNRPIDSFTNKEAATWGMGVAVILCATPLTWVVISKFEGVSISDLAYAIGALVLCVATGVATVSIARRTSAALIGVPAGGHLPTIDPAFVKSTSRVVTPSG